MEKVFCHHCRKALDLDTRVRLARTEECPHCLADIHSCKMCRFYDKSAYNECTEPIAERVVNKEKANFCDYFGLFVGSRVREDDQDSLVDAANALFKD